MEQKKINISPSNIETIDAAFLKYVEDLNTHCTTIKGWEKIPVIWSSAERSFQIKNNKAIRDANGSLIPPIISIERISSTKDPSNKGGFFANVSPKNDRYIITKILNQDKTSNFANADSLRASGQINFVTSKKNKKQVYQHLSVPIPIYITVQYKINILTNYQSQMNEAVQPFMARTAQNYFLINSDDHKYECFMEQNFEQESIASLNEEERKYKTSIGVKVLGYLIGEGNNQEKPQIIKEENAVEVKIPRENLSFLQEQEKKIKQISPNAGVETTSRLAVKKTFTIGDPAYATYTINHNLNTRDMYVSVRSNNADNDYEKVEVGISFDDLNNLTIDLGDPPLIGQQYVITIIG
jgi:hypothetical protein